MSTRRQPHEAPIIPAQRPVVTVLCVDAFLAIMVGLALRLVILFQIPASVDDSKTYLQLARNWADHQLYGLWLNGQLIPTDLRMPGYPAFLAGVAMVFGRSIWAIVLSQAALDLGTCFLVAALAAILAPATTRRRVAILGLWLTATSPFVATYSAVVLTEALAAFLTTAALLCFAAGLSQGTIPLGSVGSTAPGWRNRLSLASLGAFLTGVATLVRPEMPLLLGAALIVYGLRWWTMLNFRRMLLGCAAMTGAFLLPLVPWAARNLITLHEFQIIAPRYVTLPGEYAPVGYYAWTGTWLERYRDVYLNVWKIGEEPVDLEDLPDAAFDSPQEKARIAKLFEQYNSSADWDISPEMDGEFAEIARERTRRHPFRTYVEVPFQRALTIWFTPRTELLPMDGKLWPIRDEWEDSHADFLITAGFGALGYIYIAMAIGGIRVAWRAGRTDVRAPDTRNSSNLWGVALILTYFVVRTAFLTTVEAPEPRYVVTCYPALLALAALLWVRFPQRSSTGSG